MVAGVDLGDKHSQVCLIDLDGKVVERTKLRGGRRREVGTLSQEKVQEGER